jgi:hypothetical protein
MSVRGICAPDGVRAGQANARLRNLPFRGMLSNMRRHSRNKDVPKPARYIPFQNGYEDETKTESDNAKLPLDPALVAVLQAWRQHTPFAADSDYVFASTVMLGKKPLNRNSAQRDYLRPASIEAGQQPIGWHALRHATGRGSTRWGRASWGRKN